MRRLSTFTAIFGIIATLLLAGCGENRDELAIKNGIISMSKAVEQHDTDTFMRHIAGDYRDGHGRDKNAIRQLLEHYFEYNEQINLIISSMEIEFGEDENTAVARLRVLATGGEGKLPERGRLNEVTSQWRKQNNTWHVTRARWRPVLLQMT
ncbi:MAG: nuclear transport factor 2 family protein [Granulosicoccaceae bacterium]|jgi:hypothetical protein